MTLCPIAATAGCSRCPAFEVCPAKGILGDRPRQVRGAEENQDQTRQKNKEAADQ